MSPETIKEIIKSHVYSMSNAEIAQAYDISEEEAAKVISDNADEVEAERAYRAILEGGDGV